MSVCEGFRILRGPDWTGQDTDGGEGFLGTVTRSHGNQTVSVLWDIGWESTYSAGKDGKFELRIYDNAQAGVRHPGTTCAECGECEISGMLWRCQDCAGCDLCPPCYSDDKHDIRHRFLRIDGPDCEGQLVPKRKTSVKIRAIGIFPGSKVVRGKDWKWDDQDGGHGSEGEVTGFDTSLSVTARSLVKVQWAQGVANSYRLGLHGNVDLKCVEEDVGPFYYRDHLPRLDTTDISMAAVSEPTTAADVTSQTPQAPATNVTGSSSPNDVTNNCADTSQEQGKTTVGEADRAEEEEKFSAVVGDKVVIRVGEDKLKELQKAWGGCTAWMIKCIGSTGEVTGITTKGVICVNFGQNKCNYRFNPQALLKVAGVFHENDIVRIRGDLDLLKLLNARVGWTSVMDKTAGRVGRVVQVDHDGDLRVDFNGCQYRYSPACCLPVAAGTVVDTLHSAPSPGESGRVGADVIDKTNATSQSQETANLALMRNLREALMAESSKGQGEGDSHGMRALFTAIETEQMDRVRDICQQDPTLVERQHDGMTPLMYASLRGRIGCVVVLLDLGADVNALSRDKVNLTPLSAALGGGRKDIAEVLLTRGASMGKLFQYGFTIVHVAVVKNKPDFLRTLVTHGADLNAQDDKRNTPLHVAIKTRNHPAMEVLVDLPQVNIYLTNKDDMNMMHLCAFVDNPRALQRLMKRDCSGVEALCKGHSTALHIAATNDHVECVRLLVTDGGAQINARSLYHVTQLQTPLQIASHYARADTVEALLELGADVNARDSEGNTALHMAVGGGCEGDKSDVSGVKTVEGALKAERRIRIAINLIKAGAFLDAQNHRGRHPLLYGETDVRIGVKAFLKDNKDVVRLESGGRNVDSFLASIGVDTLSLFSHCDPKTPLRDALKGKDLPCGVCGRSHSDVTLHPCQHKCVCFACSDKITKCPLCDTIITQR